MIKDCADCLAQPLSYIIHLSLSTGIFPDEWKIAKLFYYIKVVRVISLKTTGRYPFCLSWLKLQLQNCSECCLNDRKLHRRLFDHLSKQNLLTKQQVGFRQSRSTELAATLFTDDIRKHVDYKNLIGCVFIDFSKAFDTLSHAKLLTKLPSYGINGVEFEWFKS